MIKKLLLFIFGLLTLGLINFSSAGTYTLTGTLRSSNCSNYNGTYYVSVPNSYYVNFYTSSTSVSCGFLDDGGSITSAVFYGPTNQNFTINDSNYLVSCPSGFSNYTCYGGLNGTIISYMIFKVNFHTYGNDNKCYLKFFCTFSGDIIINQSDLGNSSSSTCESDLASCKSSLLTATGNLATCQSDLATCQNTPSTPTCNSGSCKVSNYNNIVYSGTKTLSSNSTENIVDFGTTPNKTMCIKLTSSNIGNNNYLKLGFNGNKNAIASDSQEFRYDQSGQTVCLYANKRYFNINNPKTTTPDISYEIYFLNDLMNKSVPCEESQGEDNCDYTQYENTINNLSGSLSLCQSENNTLSGNLYSCELELNSCMSGIGTGDLQWSSLFINDIQHLGASTIRITIPTEINWDYTNENDEFDLDINGYNVDTEYIEGIINNQSTLPNQVDLNNIIKNVLPLFVPGLVIILFIYFVFRFIKKIF